jgi:alpha-mannosidase
MVYERYSNRVRGKLENLNKLYAGLMYKKVDSMGDLKGLDTVEHFRTPPTTGLFQLESGYVWGGEYGNLWIEGRYTVPSTLAGKKLYVIPHTDAYETLFFVNGEPNGIFNSKGDYMGIMHSAQPLTDSAIAGETFDLAFECYAHHFCVGCHPYDAYGKEVPTAPDGAFRKVFTGIDICVCDEAIYRFVFDLNIVLQMAKKLDDNNFQKHRAQSALEEVFAHIVQYPAHYEEEYVHNRVLECLDILKPVLEKGTPDSTRGSIGLIGNSHMDTAWLWPVKETIRKCARTYSNVVSLMDRYPEYTFIQSSALHLEWMRKYYPSLFERMKKYVAEGRYEPNGGVWVECDCNITSGELMARQFMYGQHFTRQYLNYTADTFWLPDTFGYNGAIPQIMQESGVKYFYTTKMGWNDLNAFPFTSFKWKGIDGTSVLVHLNSIDTSPDINDTDREIRTIRNKEYFEGRLFSFGHGDGGGGPTPAMLEKARRIMDVPGLPKAYYTTISDFMKEIEKTEDKLPVFSGELYLELHRGTLTSMHDIKRSNRKCEIALHDMDYMNVLAGKKKDEQTDDLYKALLTNQFHDILPGTCYTGVTQKAVSENKETIRSAQKISQKYASEIVTNSEKNLTFFNTTSFNRDDLLVIEGQKSIVGKPVQTYCNLLGKTETLVGNVSIPALGAITLSVSDQTSTLPSPFTFENSILNTPFFRVSFDEFGFISSLIDKRVMREIKKPNGNALNMFYTAEDVPETYDDWDIDIETMSKLHTEKRLLSFETVSNGALSYIIRLKYEIGQKSTLTQDMLFYAESPRIDFHTVVDWKEKHTLLKVGFDLDISGTTVKNEIQFGHIDRPITRNNSYEVAKFEVCNHKWSDVSESRYGVAILNDCKYGISAYDNNLCLTLLRSGTHPDTTGDEGSHEFTYSLYPHDSAFNTQNVIREAYMLNIPPVETTGTTSIAPLMKISADNIICEAIKPAALREDAFVARFYEAERNKTSCKISVPEGIQAVYKANILEDIQEELPICNGEVSLTFSPFQIVTLLFVK